MRGARKDEAVRNLVRAQNATVFDRRKARQTAGAGVRSPCESPCPAGFHLLTSGMDWSRGEYVLSDDKSRLDLDCVMAMLRTTSWANDRPREVMERAIRHSICFGLFHRGRQVGFARGVTDRATFTWVCDVIIHGDHRGQGLGRWLMHCLLGHRDLQTVSHHLRTEDAHGFYERFGFKRVEAMRRSSRPRET